MGGFNLGELAAALRLDDSDFKEKIAGSRQASALLKVEVDEVGTSIKTLSVQLRSAGFDLTQIQGYLNSLRRQGLDTQGAVDQVTGSIKRLQAEILHLQEIKSAALTESLKGIKDVPRAAPVPGQVMESFADKWAALRKDLAFASDEVKKKLDKDALARQRELFDQFKSQVTEQVQIERNAAAERIKIREAEQRRYIAGQTAVRENARIAGPGIAAEEKALGDLAKMRQFYTLQSNAADITAAAAAQAAKAGLSKEATAQHIQQLERQLASAVSSYEQDVIAKAAAERLKTKIEKEALVERATMNRVLTQGAYLGGGFMGGHATSLALFSPTGAAVAAAAIGFGLAAKEAVTFDKVLVQTTANMRGMSDDMRNRLGKAAMELSTQFPIAVEEIVKSFKDMKESGYDAQSTLVTLPLFAKFASGTMSTLSESIEHLTAIQRAFRMESSDQATNLKNLGDIANVVTKLNELGGASAAEYAKSLSAVGPEALKLGMNIRDAGAAVRVLALQDIDGSRAGEVLSRVLVTITSAAEKNAGAWRQLGVEIYDNHNKLKPFSEIMDQLARVIGTMDPKMNAFNTNLLGLSTRSDKFVASLLKQSLELRNGRAALDDLSGALDRAAAKRSDNFADQWTLAFNRIKEKAIEATTPVIKLGKDLLELANLFSMLKDVGAFGTFGVPRDADKVQVDKDGKITVKKPAPPAPAPPPAAEDLARSAAKAEEFTKKYSNDLTVLRKDLAETTKSIKAYHELLSSPKITDADRNTKEAEYDKLLAKRADLESRIKAIQDERNGKADSIKLRTESFKRQLEDFQDQYQQVISRLDEGQQAVIDSGIAKAKGLLKSKSDPKFALDALKDTEQDLKQLRRQMAEDDRAEAKEFEAQRAADSVKAFKERYTSDMRGFTSDQKALLESGIAALESEVAAGADPRQIATDLRLVEAAYKAIVDAMKSAASTQAVLDAGQQEYEQSSKRRLQLMKGAEAERFKPTQEELELSPNAAEIKALQARLANVSALGGAVTDGGGASFGDTLTLKLELAKERILALNDGMRLLGSQSQASLGMAAQHAGLAFSAVARLNGSLDEQRVAWLSAKEATIRAAEGLKPYAAEVTKLKMAFAQVASEGRQNDRLVEMEMLTIKTKALDWALNGVGKTGVNVLHELSSGWNQLGATIVKSFRHIEDFGKIWKDMLGNVLESVIGTFIQGLLNTLAGTVAKALGIGKLVGVGQITTAAAVGEANAMAATAMIPIVGPALALGVGEAMYAAIMATSLPKLAMFEQGGFVDKTQMALVHGGEFVATAKLTRGLQSLVDNGGGAGGGDHFDFRGATFGAGLTAGGVEAMMRPVVSKLRRASGRSRGGKF